MSIPERFIQRPVATTLVMMAILLFGIASYRILPVSDLPNVDYPTINVNAMLPGANPDTMAAAVALPPPGEHDASATSPSKAGPAHRLGVMRRSPPGRASLARGQSGNTGRPPPRGAP